MRDYSRIVEAARIHYENLKTDIPNAKDRVEHIRLTALAQEAHNLLTDLQAFEIGLVYTHTANVNGYLNQEDQLDLPDFKNPFAPPQPEV